MAGQVTTAFQLLGRKSQLIAGAAYDGASTRFQASTYVGGLTPLDRVFVGPGVLVDEPGTNSPVALPSRPTASVSTHPMSCSFRRSSR